MTRTIFALLLCASCGGALTSKATPVGMRYFSPESDAVRLTNADARPAHDGPKLRLGHVTSSAILRSRIVRRESAHELAMYETLRWTDNPEVYVRRALSRVLFDEGSFQAADNGDVPTLDVEVVSFEEVNGKRGRVELHYDLHTDEKVLVSGTVGAEHEASSGSMPAVVAAIGAAMDEATAALAKRLPR